MTKGQGRAEALPGSGVRRFSCVVVDRHASVLELLPRYLAEHGIDVVGTARDAAEAIAVIEREQPSVALLDVRVPGGGIAIARWLHESASATRVVLHTTGGGELLPYALELGVRGFVQKEGPLVDLVRALTAAAGGSLWIDPELSSLLVASESSEPPRMLTRRQLEVLRLIADGRTSDEVAAELFITADTVRAHLRNAMALLGARTRAHGIAIALRQALIS